MYIFLRETKVLLEYGDRFIYLDTTADISCDQTFKETSIARRTLHNKNHFFKHKKLRANNTISGNISLYITKTKQELLFLELAGWTNYGNGFSYPDFESVIPETFNLYLVNGLKSYKLNNCIITSIDLSMNKTFCGAFTVGFDASSLEEVSESPTLHAQGLHLDVTPIVTKLGSQEVQAISAGVTFTRSITYLNSETIHNSSELLESTRAIITDANFSINLNTYTVDTSIDKIDHFRVSQGGLYLELDNALITKRNTISEVYQNSFDISPTNTTNYINLGGL